MFVEWQTDKASMLDEIIDYVKFLQLQVKVLFPFLSHFSITFLNNNYNTEKNWKFQVLSMSRLGGAAAVAPLVADMSSEVIKYSYIISIRLKFDEIGKKNMWNIP